MKKQVCKRCWNDWKQVWRWPDDARWDEEDTVKCPAAVIPREGSVLDHLYNSVLKDPPDWCPYRLEHLVLSEPRMILNEHVFKDIHVREDFTILLNKFNLRGEAAEVGVRCGYYAQSLLGCGMIEKLYLIDCWDMCEVGDPSINSDELSLEVIRHTEYLTRERFEGNPRVEVIKAFSADAASQFPNGHFTFIFVDGDHTYKGVKKDIETWYPKLAPLGLIGGHDYEEYTEPSGVQRGVVKAVDEFCAREKLKIYVTPEDTIEPIVKIPSWIVQKPQGG